MECDVYGHGIPISHPPPGTPTALMNLRGVLQQDEVATLLGWATLETQVLTFWVFLKNPKALLKLSHVICPIQQT